MIFNFNESTTAPKAIDWDAVQESPYELGLDGALMTVYENECNYNALMEAVGLSELKYFQETGKDLFVHEAGAFSNFLEKAAKLFESIVEKIKGIFKKFMLAINKYVMNDTKFIEKYKGKTKAGFKIQGYEFPDFNINLSTARTIVDTIDDVKNIRDASDAKNSTNPDQDDTEKTKQENRGSILDAGDMTLEEFQKQLKEKLYGGDKKEIEVTEPELNDAIVTVKNGKKNITAMEKQHKSVIEAVNNCAKVCKKKAKEFGTSDGDKMAINILNTAVEIAKSYSNDLTIAFSMSCTAQKDANRQAKAIVIKAIQNASPKKEKPAKEEAKSESAGLFDDVVIR